MHPDTARPFPVAPAALALLLAIACDKQPLPLEPTASGRPAFDIADASRDYKPGFYWLPPMVKNPAYAGTFDAALSPTVEICELVGDACGPVIATFTTTTGTGGELVRLDGDQHYHVNWHTRDFDLSTTKLYRVSVRAGIDETLLGYADVQPVFNGSGLKRVDTDEYIGLVDGRTLPIKFRVETGIVGSVGVEPVEAEVEPGATQQFVAIVRDLHGNIVNADVSWSSSDAAVATVDQTGLATAIDEGETTITATSERISGSATLTVDRVVASVEVHPIEAEAEPGATQQFIAILRDRHGVVMTADVTWSSSDAAVATVDQTGFATAIANGGTTITATSEGISGSAMLTVESGVVVVLSAGLAHACALDPDGRAFCWGVNTQGQVGDGSRTARFSPTAVSGGLTFTAIAAGDFHTCAITALGQAYCWGFNQSGELGDGSLVRRVTPVAVSGGHTFVSISAGAQNSCGTTLGNQAYCWGQGFFGAVGNGSQANALTPQLVSGNHAFASISNGSGYACGLTTAGRAYCWGHGLNGKLGNGSVSDRLTPVAVAGDLTFTSISAGMSHTCGVTTSGQAYCWGFGTVGKLGNGSTTVTAFPTPQPVLGGLVFAQISAGEGHTCGVTVLGKGYCWGQDINGSLGTGTGSLSTPGAVVGGLTWASITPGDHFGGGLGAAFTCGVTVDRQTYCWGSGFSGSLGNGSTANRASPTPVSAFP